MQADDFLELYSCTDLPFGNVTEPQSSIAKSEARAVVAPNHRAPTARRQPAHYNVATECSPDELSLIFVYNDAHPKWSSEQSD